MAGLIEGLDAAADIAVLEPSPSPQLPPGVVSAAHPARRRSALGAIASTRPRLGWRTSGAITGVPRLPDGNRFDVVMAGFSYVAAMISDRSAPLFVDFANIEMRRSQSRVADGGVLGLVHRAEAAKARRWEPRVARSADLCSCVTAADAEVLDAWGARSVVVVPNAARTNGTMPSPAPAVVGILVNVAYPANRAGLDWLIDEVWPLVRRQVPTAILRVAGNGTLALDGGAAGVEIVGPVSSVADFYDGCALVVAPTRTGGGTQLKVVEAIGRRRVVVANRFSAGSVPPAARSAVVVADEPVDFAGAVASMLVNVEGRHDRERSIPAGAVLGWSEAVDPLRTALAALS